MNVISAISEKVGGADKMKVRSLSCNTLSNKMYLFSVLALLGCAAAMNLTNRRGILELHISGEVQPPVWCYTEAVADLVQMVQVAPHTFQLLAHRDGHYWCEDSAGLRTQVRRKRYEPVGDLVSKTILRILRGETRGNNTATQEEEEMLASVVTTESAVTSERHVRAAFQQNTKCLAQTTTDNRGQIHLWPELKSGDTYFHYQSTCVQAVRTCVTQNGTPQLTVPSSWDRDWPQFCRTMDVNITTTAKQLKNIANQQTVESEDVLLATSLVNHALQANRSVLSSSPQATMTVLDSLDAVLARVQLPPGEHIEDVQPQVAIYVLNLEKNKPFGMALEMTGVNTSLSGGSLRTLESQQDLESAHVDVAVILPQALHSSHLTIAIFSDDSAFPSRNTSQVNSRVVSVNLVNDTLDGEHIDIAFRPLTQKQGSLKHCVFWDNNISDWSTEGCRMVSEAEHDLCRCLHLTHYAVIFRNKIDDVVLDIISVVGTSLSLAGLLGIFMTGIAFRQWRTQLGNKILMHLSGAVALNMVVFLILATGVSARAHSVCVTLGVLLHYSVLASFCWMLVSAGLQFLRLVTVFGSKHISRLLLKVSLFSWGAPLLPVCTLLAVNVDLYADNGRGLCYPEGVAFYLAVLCPIIIILSTNVIVFGTILHQLCAASTIQRHVKSERKLAMRKVATSVLLFFLFGLTWLFGLFSSFSVVFAYLFCITATLQGAVLFLFFVLGEQNARRYWTNTTNVTSTTGSTPADAIALKRQS